MNIPIRVAFGQRLREMRKNTGMTQEAFADKVGFSRSYMSRLESGDANPTLDAIQALADALNVEIVELFRTER